MIPFDPVFGWWTNDPDALPPAPRTTDRRRRFIGAARCVLLLLLPVLT